MQKLKLMWAVIRQLSGDDAYERYLERYHRQEHTCDCSTVPLTRAEFFRQWQDAKWHGVKRCC